LHHFDQFLGFGHLKIIHF